MHTHTHTGGGFAVRRPDVSRIGVHMFQQVKFFDSELTKSKVSFNRYGVN